MVNIKIKKDNLYVNYGNIFSKSFIIKENKENNNSIIVFVENIKVIENYKKILNLLNNNINILENIDDFINLKYNKNGLFFCDSSFIKNSFLEDKSLDYNSFRIYNGQNIEIDDFIKKILDLGYKFSEHYFYGTYRKNGDTIIIKSFNGNYEYKISFWGDKIDSIIKNEILPLGQEIYSKIDNLYLGKKMSILNIKETKNSNYIILDYIKKLNNDSFIILDSLDFNQNYDTLIENIDKPCLLNYIKDSRFKINNLEIENVKVENIEEFKKILENNPVEIYTKNYKTIDEFKKYNNITKLNLHKTDLNILKSFKYKDNFTICDDIISKIFIRKRIKRKLCDDFDLLLKIVPGNYVVHIDHGIGKFMGVIKKNFKIKNKEVIKEYIEIEYKKNDKLFVPITEISRVSKYIGEDNPKLTGLGGNEWEKKISKANKHAEDIAEELLEIYSNRKIGNGFPFNINKEKLQNFENSFDFSYTQDQTNTINDIFESMKEDTPMDRLIVGDVGFGKTEISFNAIYNAFLNNKQTILIAPLVVLAYEHYEKACERFRQFGLKIAVLTRLETAKSTNSTILKLKSGEIDLVIGTHKLLSDKIQYKDLGLIVVDEEHKFGVKDKEFLKKYKQKIDVISMSATPIPRSLNMALSSIREMSIIKTPPFGRKPIETVVSRFDEQIVKQAGKREFDRGGQLFFIHNRVLNIELIKNKLQTIFPTKKIIITHGQLSGDQLEKRIIDFKHKKYDILLSTTVIENGIDFSNVNTIFINEASSFGISQIHQLRGRVGRSEKKGYCYMFYSNDNLKEDTAKRLKTIVEHNYLGAGFELAMKDLEIRGGGDILGCRQSGQKVEIGINLFIRMVEKKISELKKNPPSQPSPLQEEGAKKEGIILSPEGGELERGINDLNTTIDLNIDAGLPDRYFNGELDKINFYREIGNINKVEDLNTVIDDFININNSLEKKAINFFNLLKLRILASKYLITKIKRVGVNYRLDFSNNIKLYQVKDFLKLDREIKFKINSVSKLVTPTKNFKDDEFFMNYMTGMLEGKIKRGKVKIKLKV